MTTCQDGFDVSVTGVLIDGVGFVSILLYSLSEEISCGSKLINGDSSLTEVVLEWSLVSTAEVRSIVSFS